MILLGEIMTQIMMHDVQPIETCEHLILKAVYIDTCTHTNAQCTHTHIKVTYTHTHTHMQVTYTHTHTHQGDIHTHTCR